jgi:hypothetical protein
MKSADLLSDKHGKADTHLSSLDPYLCRCQVEPSALDSHSVVAGLEPHDDDPFNATRSALLRHAIDHNSERTAVSQRGVANSVFSSVANPSSRACTLHSHGQSAVRERPPAHEVAFQRWLKEGRHVAEAVALDHLPEHTPVIASLHTQLHGRPQRRYHVRSMVGRARSRSPSRGHRRACLPPIPFGTARRAPCSTHDEIPPACTFSRGCALTAAPNSSLL